MDQVMLPAHLAANPPRISSTTLTTGEEISRVRTNSAVARANIQQASFLPLFSTFS